MAQAKTYLDDQGNPIKGTGAYLNEDGTIAGPKPPSSKTAPNMNAVGGDTINGRDPNASPGFLERMANPQSGMDLIGLTGLSSAPVAVKLLPGVGPIIEKIGRLLERTGQVTKRATPYLAMGDIIGHAGSVSGLAQGAAIEAAPYAVEAAGRGAQAVGRVLQRTEPMVKFGGPVERTLAASVPAAAESSAPVASVSRAAAEIAGKGLTPEEAQAVKVLVDQGHNEADVLAELEKIRKPSSTFTPAAVKARMNAAETKEYLRLVKSGKSQDDAIAMIQAQREFVTGKGLQDTATVKQRIRERNASGRWED